MFLNEADPPPLPAHWPEGALPSLHDLARMINPPVSARLLSEGIAPRPRSWSGVYARQPNGEMTRIS